MIFNLLLVKKSFAINSFYRFSQTLYSLPSILRKSLTKSLLMSSLGLEYISFLLIIIVSLWSNDNEKH